MSNNLITINYTISQGIKVTESLMISIGRYSDSQISRLIYNLINDGNDRANFVYVASINAASSGNLELLKSVGPAIDKYSYELFYNAIREDRTNIVEFMLSRNKYDVKIINDLNVLAMNNGNLELIRLFVESGSTNTKDKYLQSLEGIDVQDLLTESVIYSNRGQVRKWLAKGAIPDGTIINLALEVGDIIVFKTLIKFYQNDRKNYKTLIPVLTTAVENDYNGIVLMLIDTVQDLKEIALRLAIKSNRIKLIREILDRYPITEDRSLQNYFSKKYILQQYLLKAIDSGDIEMVMVFIEHGAIPSKEHICKSIKSRNFTIFSYLIRLDIENINKDSKSIVKCAINSKDNQILDELLEIPKFKQVYDKK